MSGRIDDLTSLVDNGQPFRNRIKEGLPTDHPGIRLGIPQLSCRLQPLLRVTVYQF